MKKTEKALAITEILDRLYPDPQVTLHHSSPFMLLVATVLSGQSTDAVVNRITPRLFDCADTPGRMQRLSVAKIADLIRPCGLAPTKARNLHALAAILEQRFGGQVPASFAALEALPGVGHKTASVVMAQAFDVPAFPVDTHIHRLAYRWGLSTGQAVARTERDLRRLFPPTQWRRLHLQLIYYGRAYCPARGHALDRCLICRQCGVRSRLRATGSALGSTA